MNHKKLLILIFLLSTNNHCMLRSEKEKKLTRHQLYAAIVDKKDVLKNSELIKQIQKAPAYYLDLIADVKDNLASKSIDANEINPRKISLGIIKLLFLASIPVGGYAFHNVVGLPSLLVSENSVLPRLTVGAGIVAASGYLMYRGGKDIYKGFHYLEQVEKRRDRDQQVIDFIKALPGCN